MSKMLGRYITWMQRAISVENLKQASVHSKARNCAINGSGDFFDMLERADVVCRARSVRENKLRIASVVTSVRRSAGWTQQEAQHVADLHDMDINR